MPPLEYLPGVDEEIKNAYLWYESKSKGLGDDFIKELEEGFSSIQILPDTWPPLSKKFRRYLLHRFPYGIIYSVRPDRILVAAVMHTSRGPDYWRKRIPEK